MAELPGLIFASHGLYLGGDWLISYCAQIQYDLIWLSSDIHRNSRFVTLCSSVTQAGTTVSSGYIKI